MIRVISKNALQLGFVAALCVAILGLTNKLTQPRIQQQTQLSKINMLLEVAPEITDGPRLLADCVMLTNREYLGRNTPQALYRWRENDAVTAYILETTAPDGYSGNIDIIAAVRPDGTVIGSRVLNHMETPGLGDKIERRRSDWILSFNERPVTAQNAKEWAVKKEGGQFDQFTGATITPRAVINAVRRASLYVTQHPELAALPADCEE